MIKGDRRLMEVAQSSVLVCNSFHFVDSRLLCGAARISLWAGSCPCGLFFLVGKSLPSKLRLQPFYRPALFLLPRSPLGLRLIGQRQSPGATLGNDTPEFWWRCGTPNRGRLDGDILEVWNFGCMPCLLSLSVLTLLVTVFFQI